MDTGARPATRVSELVESILLHADELGLDDRQIAALSRLYWSCGGRSPAPEVVSAVASLLSSEQFRAAVGRFAESGETARAAAGTDAETVDAMVASALDKRTKDKSLIEIELATKVADRLIAWSKTFGIFVAAPVAILLLILSLFGLSKFEDVSKAADRAGELLKQAQSRLTDGNAKLELAERKVMELTDLANQRAQQVDRQLVMLNENSAKISSQVTSLGNTVQRIESQLGGMSAQFETGNQESGAVLSNEHIKLYGTWGMTNKTVRNFVTAADFPWRQDFEGRFPGSLEFDSAWRKLGDRENARFKEAQRVYIQTQFFDPAVNWLKERCGLDVTVRSRALQEVVWDIGVLHGSASGPLNDACQELRDQRKWNFADPGFDEMFIRQSYAGLGKWAPHFKLQYEQHLRAALAQLAIEQKQNRKP